MGGGVEIVREQRVAWVCYTNGDTDLLDPEGLVALRRALASLVSDPGVRVVVLTGRPGRFPIQLDPGEARQMAEAAPPLGPFAGIAVRILAAALHRLPWLQRLLDGGGPAALRRVAYANLLVCAALLERSDTISVAALEGPVYGGGMELALCCDLRVCSDAADTWLAQPEVLAGVMAGFGATQRLPRLVGTARALELLLLCEAVGPGEAARIGLVNRVLPADGFRGAVGALAHRLASRPALAAAATKRAVRQALGPPDPGVEARQMMGVWRSAEASRGLQRASEALSEALEQPQRPLLPQLLERFESG
ncbi:MAG TPA: enoyl-CoA hydratase/isomerase family protein [Deltaproteobacteria bacterium]|nr:enoyl-CoA hydratase/isomerase family protein [Deltaproteobacteria bacterium]